jgi:signal transduction histidine kinase
MANQSTAYLFVPENRPERFDKACSAAQGMVTIDLEDAVPPEQEDASRDARDVPPRCTRRHAPQGRIAEQCRLHRACQRRRHSLDRHERESIARSLHDTYLQSAQGLLLSTDGALKKLPADGEVRTDFECSCCE